MLEPLHVALASLAGGCCSVAMVSAMGLEPRPGDVRVSIARLGRAARAMRARAMVETAIANAGWQESPERLALLGLALAGAGGLVAGAAGMALAPLGFTAGGIAVPFALARAVAARRAALAAELVPLLELFTLELSGGGSALAALGSVTVQVEGELAAGLRRMLIASQVTGSASFESRLIEFAQRSGISALASLATVLAASREFGTSASPGVRALAIDLRRAQRRELITHSRRALNLVLLPAAVGVLLPFLGVLLFPAVSVLQRSLR